MQCVDEFVVPVLSPVPMPRARPDADRAMAQQAREVRIERGCGRPGP